MTINELDPATERVLKKHGMMADPEKQVKCHVEGLSRENRKCYHCNALIKKHEKVVAATLENGDLVHYHPKCFNRREK